MSGWHDWYSWEHYLSIHHSHLDRYRDYFILENRLSIQQSVASVRWTGDLLCSGGFEIHVDKKQDVRYASNQPQVRTVKYSYQVLRRTEGQVVNYFRYDNVHVHENHADAHHRHQYDVYGQEINPPVHIGAENWPNLGEVIDETYKLWEQAQSH